jgi:CheY-like chemotaxis protein
LNGTHSGTGEQPAAGKMILVVDDERPIVTKTAEALQAAGYATAHAYDGVEATEWLEANPPPQIILLDIFMPRMDGFQVLEWLQARDRYAGTSVVLLSTKPSDADVTNFLIGTGSRADSLLWKPFTQEDAVAIVQRRLEGITGTLPRGYQPKPPPPASTEPATPWFRRLFRRRTL